jgi:hypothetical protein
MSEVWDQARIEQYRLDGTEESLTLDYKAAASLDKSDNKKKDEVRKDVSAMANSAGGIIVYGVAEDPTNKHLPGTIDPIDRNQISKEWLDQVISNIRPKIDGLIIHPVPINTALNHVVYVVEIPQSYTAHQATDKRYYKRSNFESVAMEDYEIRDVMGRRQNAKIELDFKILVRTETLTSYADMFPSYDVFGKSTKKEPAKKVVFELHIRMKNTGKVLAQYIDAYIEIPCDLVYDDYEDIRDNLGNPPKETNLDRRCEYHRDNTVRDYIKGGSVIGSPAEYGPARYVPILPSTKMLADELRLNSDFEAIDWEDRELKWTTHADNAPPHTGSIRIADIDVLDKRDVDPSDFDEANYSVFD